jgi:hypothetical protein
MRTGEVSWRNSNPEMRPVQMDILRLLLMTMELGTISGKLI